MPNNTNPSTVTTSSPSTNPLKDYYNKIHADSKKVKVAKSSSSPLSKESAKAATSENTTPRVITPSRNGQPPSSPFYVNTSPQPAANQLQSHYIGVPTNDRVLTTQPQVVTPQPHMHDVVEPSSGGQRPRIQRGGLTNFLRNQYYNLLETARNVRYGKPGSERLARTNHREALKREKTYLNLLQTCFAEYPSIGQFENIAADLVIITKDAENLNELPKTQDAITRKEITNNQLGSKLRGYLRLLREANRPLSMEDLMNWYKGRQTELKNQISHAEQYIKTLESELERIELRLNS